MKQFKDLPKGVQEKLLAKYRDCNVDYGWWEYILDDWKHKLHELGFENAEIYFSGFWNQGDGACFDCKKINLKKLIEHYQTDFIRIFFPHHQRVLKYIKEAYIDACTRITNHHYVHENTREIVIYWYGEDELNEIDNIDNMLIEFESFVESVRHDLCKEIYRDLEREYEYLTADEAIIDTIEINEWHLDYFDDEKLQRAEQAATYSAQNTHKEVALYA